MIIGDFIAVINSFLTGELTMRFVLKALAMFFISGSIFYYYLAQLKEKNVKWLDLFSWVIVAIVVLTVAWGFAVIGSPFQQRNKRFDERRVQDLQIMQNYITNYWQNKERLPVSLSDLEDPLLGIVIPVDPETGGLYEYRVTDDLIFELCAMFSTESKYGQGAVPEMYSRGSQNYSWQHGVGRICFERTIDPDFFEKGKAVPRPL
jgi:hypothetical protein